MLFIFKSGRVDIHILFHLPCQDSIFCWDFKIYIFSYSKRLLVVSPETHLKVVRRLGNCTIVVFIVCKIHRGVRLGSRRESGYNKSSCFICNSPELCKIIQKKVKWTEDDSAEDWQLIMSPPGGNTLHISSVGGQGGLWAHLHHCMIPTTELLQQESTRANTFTLVYFSFYRVR